MHQNLRCNLIHFYHFYLFACLNLEVKVFYLIGYLQLLFSFSFSDSWSDFQDDSDPDFQDDSDPDSQYDSDPDSQYDSDPDPESDGVLYTDSY